MVPQTLSFPGGSLCCAITHLDSGAVITTDAPKDLKGDGSSFSPTDLLCSALASCIVTTMALWARKKGFELGAVTAHIEKHMTTSLPRTIARVVVDLRFASAYTPEQQQVLIDAAHGCPVALALRNEVQQDVRFAWAG